MNILFMAYREAAKIFCAVAKEIERNYSDKIKIDKYFFLTDSLSYVDYLKMHAPAGKSEIIFQYDEDFQKGLPQDMEYAELQNYEHKYGVPNLWMYVVSDRIFSKLSDIEALRMLYAHINYFENFYDSNPTNAIISTGIAGLSVWLAHSIGKARGVKNLSVYSSRILERMVITDNAFDQWTNLGKEYNGLLKRELTSEEYKIAKEIKHLYTKKKIKPFYFEPNKIIAKFPSIKKYINYCIEHAFKKTQYTSLGIINLMKISMLRRIRLALLGFSGLSHFRKPDYKEKYFFYALHLQPEASIDIVAPLYRDQIATIDNISKCLPIGYKLYVKEHPAFVGMRPLNYYSKLAHLANVRLIDSTVNAYKLIENSTGIITLSGTVGWEAMMMGKPVITLGRVFYNVAEDLVKHVRSINELPRVLQEFTRGFKPNEENILKFILAAYKCTDPGIIIPPSQSLHMLQDENIGNVTEAIVKKIRQV